MTFHHQPHYPTISGKTYPLLIGMMLFSFVNSAFSQAVSNHQLDTVLTPSFEKIDSNILFFRKRHWTPKGLVFDINGDTIDVGGIINIRDHRKTVIRKIQIEATGFHPVVYDFSEFISPYFYIRKTFYGNGNIRRKAIDSWLGFSIGKEYLFNEKGKLTKIEDFDKHYKFTFEDVLEFCRQNNISIEKNEMGGNQPAVKRLKYHGRPSWFITSWYPKVNKWVTIVLDGKTGKIKEISPTPIYHES